VRARSRAAPALLAFALVFVAGQLAVGMRASRTAPITGDEPFYLLTTQSLVSDGDLDLRDEYRQREYERFWDSDVDLWTQMTPTGDGRLLSPHDPGLSLLVLPAYWVGGTAGVQRALVLLWAAAMACAVVVACRLRVPAWAAVLGAVVVGAGPPGLVYASQIYPEGPAALGVGVGVVLATGRVWRRPWLEGAAMAATVAGMAWLGVKYVPVAAVVLGVWARSRRHERQALWTAAGLLTGAALHSIWWHLHTFGGLTPYATNIVYSGEGSASIIAEHLTIPGRGYRLYGLFLDARFGLLRWLPAAAIAGIGLVVLGRRRAALPAAVFATGVLMGTFASITMMGWWFPGRMLIAGFPALAVLVGAGAARIPRLAIALSAWSVAISAALAWSAHHRGVRLAVDPFTLGFPLPPQSWFPDFRSFGTEQVLLSLAWGVALAGLTVLLRRLASERSGQGPPPRRALARVPRLLRAAD
jgi:hypothetical protein